MKTQMKLITAPTESPVTVAEAKDYLRIDNNLEDTRIQVMIDAATRYLEGYTGLKFVTQTWDVFLDTWPMRSTDDWWDGVKEGPISMLTSMQRDIILPIGPAQSLTQFETYADDGIAVQETIANYIFDDVGSRARVGLKIGAVWPVTVLRRINAIKFRVVVGFGTAAQVPQDIKQAVLEVASHMYENRGDQNLKIPPHILSLVDHRRRVKVGF